MIILFQTSKKGSNQEALEVNSAIDKYTQWLGESLLLQQQEQEQQHHVRE